jgi:hypothetical protein
MHDISVKEKIPRNIFIVKFVTKKFFSVGKFCGSETLRIQRPPLTIAGSNPPAPIAMTTHITAFLSKTTKTIVVERRTWEGLVSTETKTFVKVGDSDYNYVLQKCQEDKLL